jgi:uncharacterized protein (TIGR03437 family)
MTSRLVGLRQSARVLSLPLLAWLAVIPAVMSGAGVRVLFDPASPSTGPYPTDLLTLPDAQQKTGVRINVPLPDCNAEPSTCAETQTLNLLDGFNLRPRAAVRFSGAVDLHSIETGVFFVWLENITREEQGLRPQGYTTQINQLVYDSLTQTAYFKPNEIFDQHRRYLLVVTDEVRDAAGDPVEPDPAFVACVTQPSNEYCSRLAAALETVPDSARVVAASEFSTLSATAWVESARRRLAETPPNFRRAADVNVVSIRGLSSITLRQETRTNPQEFDDFTVPFPSLLLPNLDQVFFGIYESPDYLTSDQTIPDVPTAGEIPPAEATRDIYFHVLLPRTAPPPGGYPVAIFGHGLGDNSFGASTILGNTLAESGFATVAINAVGHGGGSGGMVVFTPPAGAATTFALGGRSVDLNGDGAIESSEGCVLFESEPIGLRDCLRQTVVDLMQLVRLIREGPDLDGAKGVVLDGSRIYYAGQSLGALYGSLLHAVEPNVRAAVLNVGGGSVIDIARTSDAYQDFVSHYLSTRNPPLLSPGELFEDNFPLRNAAPLVNEAPGAILIQDLLERAEWMQMPGDPLAYAPHFQRSTLPGVAPKPVLFQIARGDKTVPNPQNSALIAAAGLRQNTQLYRHDLARQAVPTLRENPHAYLVEIENFLGASARIADAVQQQLAGFLATDGVVLRDVNVLVQGFFDFPIFETPTVLPDDLGSDAEAAMVSAASFLPTLAPDSIASVFGPDLASDLTVATQLPLPTILLDTTVRIVDSAGRRQFGQLIAVSPQQVNLVIPPEAALGPAEVVVNNGNKVARGVIVLEAVAPALFTARQSGEGPPPAVLTTLIGPFFRTDGVALCGSGAEACESLPITFGDEGGDLYLALFSTGLRGHAALDEISATIGGEEVPVLFAGAQGEYAGLDQVNLGPLPRSLAGRGEVEIVITISGRQSNPVTVSVE